MSMKTDKGLRLIRGLYGLNQSQLAKKLGISQSFLCEVESGKKQPSLEFLENYAKVFGLSLSSLVKFMEDLKED